MREVGARIGADTSGFVWVDIPVWSDDAEAYLRALGCHEMVLESCRTRNHVPTVHGYADHVFITPQSPLLGEAGHDHVLEPDQIIGPDFLVTVHGPLNPVVPWEEGHAETDSVLRRIESGRFRPSTPHELSFAVTSARDYLRDLADQFERARSTADGESHFLFGVIELYQTKVNTKMTVAMERLAVIAAVTLPITAIASIEGMNMVMAIDENRVELSIVLLIMAVMSYVLLRWARRQGWW